MASFRLPDQQLLALWDVGEVQPAVVRGLSCVHAVFPNEPLELIARWSLGRRNNALLGVLHDNFGPECHCSADCPQCDLELEVVADTEELGFDRHRVYVMDVIEVEVGGAVVRHRLPDSVDLAACAACGDEDSAVLLLARRLIVDVDGMQLGADHTPVREVVARIARSVENGDPACSSLADVTCPQCGKGWSILFDVETFLWSSLRSMAGRLMRDVQLMAFHYHWSESEILSLSTQRRQRYLQVVS